MTELEIDLRRQALEDPEARMVLADYLEEQGQSLIYICNGEDFDRYGRIGCFPGDQNISHANGYGDGNEFAHGSMSAGDGMSEGALAQFPEHPRQYGDGTGYGNWKKDKSYLDK